mgnify:CR=1 FL=1
MADELERALAGGGGDASARAARRFAAAMLEAAEEDIVTIVVGFVPTKEGRAALTRAVEEAKAAAASMGDKLKLKPFVVVR